MRRILSAGSSPANVRGCSRHPSLPTWLRFEVGRDLGEDMSQMLNRLAIKDAAAVGGCGHVSAENRKTQAKFVCVECGFSANADLVGAVNIKEAGLALLDPVRNLRLKQGRRVRNPPRASYTKASACRNPLPSGRGGCQGARVLTAPVARAIYKKHTFWRLLSEGKQETVRKSAGRWRDYQRIPTGFHPAPENFPVRNRIIAGMPLGVVIVGANNTADR
jgi:hypothetical protein